MPQIQFCVPCYQLPGDAPNTFQWNPEQRTTFPVGSMVGLADTRMQILAPDQPVPSRDGFARVEFDAAGKMLLRVYHGMGGSEKPCLDVITGGRSPLEPGAGHYEEGAAATAIEVDRPGDVNIDYGIWDSDADPLRKRLENVWVQLPDDPNSGHYEPITPNPLTGAVCSGYAVDEPIDPPAPPDPVPPQPTEPWNPDSKPVIRGWVEQGGNFPVLHDEHGGLWNKLR